MSDRTGGSRRRSRVPGLTGWFREFFEPGATWERPLPAGAARRDLLLVVLYLALASAALELSRSVAAFHSLTIDGWAQHALIWLGVLPLGWRRVAPVTSCAAAVAVFLAICTVFPVLAMQWSMQVTAFAAVYSMFAWARDRRAALAVGGALLLAVFLWLAWSFALSSGIEDFLEQRGDGLDRTGILSPVLALLLYNVLMNALYFCGAALVGQVVWRGARQRHQLELQNAQLQVQAETLRDQARIQERLRIARELHDVVAHHVSVIGVQAAGARRVLHKDLDLAAQGLAVVEESSRRAVTEMRSLLGTLRSAPSGDSGDDKPREPDPSVSDIATLVSGDVGLQIDYREVLESEDALQSVPPGVGLALYRTIQESLSNIRKHSTATASEVTLRVGPSREGAWFAEVEILDDGRPRRGTSGTGLGLLGVRERLSSLGGTSEIGPRAMGGYRVRVRFPIPRPGAQSPSGTSRASNAKTTA